jgi:hypothetical protein
VKGGGRHFREGPEAVESSYQHLFANILRLVADLWVPPHPALARDKRLSRAGAENAAKCVLMKTKSTFPARGALMSSALVHVSPHGRGPVLPIHFHSSNLSLNKPVIEWMPAKTVKEKRRDRI